MMIFCSNFYYGKLEFQESDVSPVESAKHLIWKKKKTLVFIIALKATKLKKGRNFPKILQIITNFELDLYFTIKYPSANLQ